MFIFKTQRIFHLQRSYFNLEKMVKARGFANYLFRQHGKNRAGQWAEPVRRGTVGRLGILTEFSRGPPVPPNRTPRSDRGTTVGIVLTPSPGIGRHSLERFYRK